MAELARTHAEENAVVRTLAPLASLLLLALLVGCPAEPVYEQLNLETDCFEVVISPDAAGDDDDSGSDDDDSASDDDDSASDDDDASGDDDDVDVGQIDIHATVGFFDIDVIGEASISPTSGPAGTRFDLVVVLLDTGTDEGNPVEATERVTILVDNGEVTLNEFDLRESPADERRWSLQLEAGGTDQSRRTDSICIALYKEI